MPNVHRQTGGFDFIPPAVMGGAGLASGVLSTYGQKLGTYRMGVFKAALIALGLGGELALGWDSDVTYALMGAGTYGLAEQVAPAIKHGGKTLLTMAAPDAAPVRHAAGCTSCASRAAGMAPQAPVPSFFRDYPRATETAPTAAGLAPRAPVPPFYDGPRARETAPTAAGLGGPFAKETTPTLAGYARPLRRETSTTLAG